ncbi:MAG: HlyC/CorC family transporter [Gemmatimonadetes bacterium]|nr:HlyC/CorC family transporter [Gemmatimonadota bacterium]
MIQSGLALEALLIVLLILANGILAMSEIAVVSARKARLRSRAEAGDARARRALELAEQPTRFLSTVQIGITLVGVLLGAYGGASIAAHLARALARAPALAGYSGQIALALVVGALTFLSLVLGELVPKSIGLAHPERIAAWVGGPVTRLSAAAAPLVKLLSVTTDGVLRLLRVRRFAEPPVTEAEVAAMLEAGAEAGIFEAQEQELVERVFWLADQRAATLMTPRHAVVWLDVSDPPDMQRAEILRQRAPEFLVCDGDVDHLLGTVRVLDLLPALVEGAPLDLRAVLRKPLFVPETVRALRLLDLFRRSGAGIAVIGDEYGGVEGIVRLEELLEELAGAVGPEAGPGMVRRADGSWLVDGALDVDEFREGLGLHERRTTERPGYHTVAGFVVARLGRIPSAGDVLEADGLRIEVVDMDGRRVDKLLVSRLPRAGEHTGADARGRV